MELTHGLRVRWTEVDRRPVRSLEAGEGDLAAVLVPGLGALGYLVDATRACARGARAALLDVPGFGHPRPWPCTADVPDVARAVAGWLRAAAPRPVVLFGHSTGAQAAIRAAAAAPERVAALVLGGPTFPPALRRFAGLVPAFARNSRHEPAGEIPVTWPYYLRGGPASMARYLRSGQRDEPERAIRGVRCPVTVVRGEHDALCPADWAAELAGAAPDGRVRTVPGAHAFPYGRGELTAELLVGAVADRSGG